ncbi:unnamed protein product [Rotaria socialis]|uniref:Melanin-concentrating hormone n=1 Tax=Rotaria socialis TaxID=392032 RepID=A0A818HMA4_9BILA|nr:unnamed protein product [Rotaria socialis]CAF3382858.1 unnamed protein product [Rotaria socialis]CAF3386031.1 unnamed protein product [Rotaria socialis]CAF3508499.1 unnamed protein product [Rotaria socialis]
MHHSTLCCILYLLVLQQTMSAASFVPFLRTSDLKSIKSFAIRPLRTPVMSRSVLTSFIDDTDLMEHETEGINLSDYDQLMKFKTRPLIMTLLNQRRWMNSKRRGPLLG